MVMGLPSSILYDEFPIQVIYMPDKGAFHLVTQASISYSDPSIGLTI